MTSLEFEPILPQPDEDAIQWLALYTNVRVIKYGGPEGTQVIDPVYSQTTMENVHDAWRSTKISQDSDDERLNMTVNELEQGEIMLTVLTSTDIRESIHEQIHAFMPRGRGFDNAFVYRAMNMAYHKYLIMKTDMGDLDSKYMGDDKYELPLPGWHHYNKFDPATKEVDRRMVMTSMLELERPGTPLCDDEQQRQQLLQDPNVQAMIADGKAILASVHEGITYDETQGFAHDTIYWNPKAINPFQTWQEESQEQL